MEMKIGVIKGDGIGPEIVDEAMKVLDQTAKVYGHSISYTQLLMGGASIDVNGVPLTEETLQLAKDSDAVLMGSIGGDAKTSPWYQLEPSKRPEAGLLQLRKGLNLFANLRPAVLYDELKGACPLKKEIADRGFDLMIMRELTGGLYFGKRSTEEIDGVLTAKDELTYNENEIRRIAKRAFDIAMKRRKKVTSVDKANVLDSSRLWRSVVEDVAKDYPDVTLEHMLVDNCAMQIVHNPCQFDVVLTENMFGDILSDEASMVTGSIGMLSSASLNDTRFGLYEPSGGSAPDIAGKGIANPIATILSAAMMLRYTFDLDKEAEAIEAAVKQVLKDGYRTIDIMPQEEDKKKNEPERFQALQPDKLPEIKEFSFAEQAPHIERPQNQESQAANLGNTVSAKKDTPVEEKEESLPENNNDKILRLHKQGMSSVDIAKELGLGVGEVKLVINLFKGA